MEDFPRILLIDDDEDDHVLVHDMLAEAAGGEPNLDCVSEWDDGLKAVVGGNYDVYLVDYRLGERDGLDLIREAVAQGCPAPSILLTSQDSRDVDVSAGEAGAADYLVKGRITGPLLERAIRYAIARQQFLVTQIEANQLLKKKNLKLSQLYDTAHQFVDNVSHEFRTPLTVIREFISILQDGLAGEVNEQQREYLGIAIDRVDDLNIMVNDMLDISRLEAGLLGIARDECRIETIVERVRPTLERKALSRNIVLNFEIDDELPAIFCDAENIGRVIINLAVNAIKFCGDEGRTTLWARLGADTSEVIFGVSDDGPGIAQESIDQIFGRFEKLDASIQSSTKGFGLGLNIAKQLVELNLGEISVESRIGEGATFSFNVPVYEPSRILEKYLSRLGRLSDQSSYVTLISTQIGPSLNSELVEEVGRFLQHQVRVSDLFFPRRPGSWLLVAATDRHELEPLLHRFDKARADANRNRVGDELPEIEFEVLGTWPSTTQSPEMFRRFSALFGISTENGPEFGEAPLASPAVTHKPAQSEQPRTAAAGNAKQARG